MLNNLKTEICKLLRNCIVGQQNVCSIFFILYVKEGHIMLNFHCGRLMYEFLFDFRSIYARGVCAVRNRKIAPWNRTGIEDKRNYISLSGRLSEKLNYVSHFSGDETFSWS